MTTRFIKLYERAPDIEAASADARDHTPLRARKYCQPMNVASMIGWHIFPPIDFHLMWEGRSFLCMFGEQDDWMLIDRIFLPGYAEEYERALPQDAPRAIPAFLDVFPELGVIQIWTGYIVRTSGKRSLWVRAPINLPGSLNYDVFDGIIETDWWFGALIVNLRFHKTDVPVAFQRAKPLCQVFSVPRELYARDNNADFKIETGLASLTSADWENWRRDSDRLNTERPGSYITEAKKHR
jgi:hypothetical protein